MARVSIKSICDELMVEFKTVLFIQKRLLKKLDKEVGEDAIKAQANRLVREGVIDHAKAAKKYGIRGPKVDAVEAKPTKTMRKPKADKADKADKPAKRTMRGTMRKAKAPKADKADKPAKASKKKSEKVSKASKKSSSKEGKTSKSLKTRRRSKA